MIFSYFLCIETFYDNFLVLSFDCPKPTRRRKQRKIGYHRHETHCDKYYVCKRNQSTEVTCPDGKIFNYKNAHLGAQCILPIEGDCGGLTEFQPAQPSGPCKRQHGYFELDDDTTCQKYVQCTDGAAIPHECPQGTAFSIKGGNCDWPDNVKTCNLTKLYGFACPSNYLVLALKYGSNVKFTDPNDCRSFFTCNREGKPRKLGCPLGTVFNDKSQKCDEPKNVPGCEKYYKDSEEEEDDDYYYDDEYYDDYYSDNSSSEEKKNNKN